jgi:Clp amino terminal domain, pathogenicity island component
LFLGVLDEEECLAAKLLREAGADAGSIRVQLAGSAGK